MVGRTLKKAFGKATYEGTVKSYDSKAGYFKIVYKDGDVEELNLEELEPLLVPTRDRPQADVATGMDIRLVPGDESEEMDTGSDDGVDEDDNEEFEAWDVPCTVCGRRDEPEGDEIVLCDGNRCKVAKHRSCAGLSKVPTNDWLCPDCVVQSREAALSLVNETGLEPHPADRFLYAVISKGRPDNVGAIHELFEGTGVWPTWYVGEGECGAYEAAGAKHVKEGGGLCQARNRALEDAKAAGHMCLQMSDDVCKLQMCRLGGEACLPDDDFRRPGLDKSNRFAGGCDKFSLTVPGAAQVIESRMRLCDAKLGGTYPNHNGGQAFNTSPVTNEHFVVGDFIVVDPTCTPRFDETLTLKEDYDFTAQHLHTYGKICRVNRLLQWTLHYTNEGGAVAVRNFRVEKTNIGILRRKWPGAFLNSWRGPTEVVLRWEYRDKSLGGHRDIGKNGKPVPIKKPDKRKTRGKSAKTAAATEAAPATA